MVALNLCESKYYKIMSADIFVSDFPGNSSNE